MDHEGLSVDARAIFEKIKPHFPLDPWGKPRWTEEGKVFDNGWFDLRKKADRRRLEEQRKSFLGYLVQVRARAYRDRNHQSIEGFAGEPFSQVIEDYAELLLFLEDLDFQIETMDLAEN